jgi:hypothetical protein
MFFFSQYVRPSEEPLLKWVVENEALIRQGAATYENKVVTMQSTLVRYECVMSFILYTGRTSSPLLLAETESAKSTFIRMTALTMCLGWWALFGVVYTPQALWTNFSGGDKKTVSEILEIINTPESAKKKDPSLAVLPVVPLFMLGVVVFAFLAVGVAIIAHKITGH